MSQRSPELKEHLQREHQIGTLQVFLKQIVYGGNDGIVTTFAIVAGFAGAGSGETAAQIGGVAVLLFGLANLFADATAMGLGEFLSARSERDVYHAARIKELQEIHENPKMEHAEMVEILEDRGVTTADATDLTNILARHPDFMADMMMQYEIGMQDPDGENPALNGLATFIAFVLFGAIPISPYFLLPPSEATFLFSVAGTLFALVALGLLRWRVTIQTLSRCVGETVLVGGTCALVAFGVGLLFR